MYVMDATKVDIRDEPNSVVMASFSVVVVVFT